MHFIFIALLGVLTNRPQTALAFNSLYRGNTLNTFKAVLRLPMNQNILGKTMTSQFVVLPIQSKHLTLKVHL